jgi:hypothetical protein
MDALIVVDYHALVPAHEFVFHLMSISVAISDKTDSAEESKQGKRRKN